MIKGSVGKGFPMTFIATTTQTPPTIAPEDSQSDDQSGTGGGGGVKPPLKDNLLPDTGIREQPEVQQPEEPSNEGEGPAGPLT